MHYENKCHRGRMNHMDFGSRAKFGGRYGQHFGRQQHDFFGRHLKRVPVNIEETDHSFIINLYAPALTKENLKVSTKDDILTITYTPNAENTDNISYTRREYGHWPFERSFALNGKVLNDQISAKYSDGILRVSLPKNPETNTPAKEISVD